MKINHYFCTIQLLIIDTEVSLQMKKVVDFGAVREDGAVLHSHFKADFDAFQQNRHYFQRGNGILCCIIPRQWENLVCNK